MYLLEGLISVPENLRDEVCVEKIKYIELRNRYYEQIENALAVVTNPNELEMAKLEFKQVFEDLQQTINNINQFVQMIVENRREEPSAKRRMHH